ncbi:LLM class flavin-dependent oxidoreductase [Prescottella equi]|uniref:LLM class flavin-dependent oxidoreductase n=1 Tax=Rhodococcus hoagii TaxID=43767 RepID=UPI001F2D9FA0|nr:LLM class flavin-dependent oxidoreductase [Prescottella equi]
MCPAEHLGLDSFRIAQQQFGVQRDSPSRPSPLVVLSTVPERARLGTAVTVDSREDSICLGERAATMDALSGGRLELGAGPRTTTRFGTLLGEPVFLSSAPYRRRRRNLIFDAATSRECGPTAPPTMTMTMIHSSDGVRRPPQLAVRG